MTERTVVENGTVPTLCRMCSNRCSIVVHIEDGNMVDVRPLAGNPVNHGKMCPRGRASLDVFYHKDRICKPLKRQTDGTFIEIGLEQALDEIAKKMLDVKGRWGARSMGVWKGEAIGFLQQEEYARRFAHAFGTPNYFSNDSACYNGRFLGHHLVTGFWNPFPYYAEADLILLFGTNPPVCHPPFMAEFADAKARGANLVVVDPRLNPVACYADIFAQPLPGTDGALAWGLIRYLVNAGGYDPTFVEQHSVGFEDVVEYAQKFTPDYVEKETGVFAHVVVDIAKLIIQNRPKISYYMGAGLEHHDNGVNNIRAMVVLSCLSGGLDIACGLGWPASMPRNELTLHDQLPLTAEKPIGADRFPVLYDIRKECHTMTAMDYMLGREEYPLKGLIVTAANPAVTNPNTGKVEEALKALDLLVVNDLFMTRTARLAHYVLPAASFLERSEIHIDPKYQRVFLTQKVVEDPGIKDEYMLWHDLAWRLGFGERYFPWDTENQVNAYILEPSGITLKDLEAHPEGIQYSPLKYQKHLSRPLPTPSGKLEFTSAYLEKLGYAALPEYVRPYHLRHPSDAYPLLLTTGARKTLYYHSRHQNLEHFRKLHPEAEVEMHPEDAAGLGVENGDQVRIISETGEVTVAASVLHKAELRRGVVEMYHGWEEWRINFTTFDLINDPISGFPLLKGVPVRIETVK
ncbi:MAG: molybdopterin-dependent oxidoreductase [Thermodesulfobacteriota bacterium]